MFDTMSLTKVVAAICGAWLVLLLGNWAGEGLYHVGGHYEQAYSIEVEESSAEAEEVAEVSFDVVYASADAGAGERLWRQCAACHKLEDGANGTGPHLYAVVGRDKGVVDGFGYSEVLATMEGDWTPENLSGFLANPKDYAPGTKMSYAGMKDVADRANLIAYLNTFGGNADPSTFAEAAAAAVADAADAVEDAVEGAAETVSDAVEGVAEAAEEMISGEAPAEEAAAEAAEEAPAETATEEAAAEEAPAEEAPAEEAATEEAPAEEAPAEEAVAEEAPSDEAPAEEATAEEAPAEEAAAEEAPAEEAATETASAEVDPILASADASKGERLWRQCAACHKLEEGGKAIGPHLYGVVGRDKASVEGFGYSDALMGLEGAWTPTDLDAFLTRPRDYAPGTKMTYAGMRKAEDRANLIAYLNGIGG